MKSGKAVIWTSKVFVADPYPFQDDGDNYTYFYKNLYDSLPFLECLACLSDQEKKELVSKAINMPINKFILESKKSHYKATRK